MFNWRVLLQLLLGLTLSFLFFYMMSPFLIAIFLGGVIAMVCYPLHSWLKSKMPGSLSALVVTLLLAVGIFLPIFGILYSVSFKLLQFAGRLNLEEINTSFTSMINHLRVNHFISLISDFFPDWGSEHLGTVAQKIVERFSRFVTATIAGTPTVLMGIAVTVVTLYFFLLDGARFVLFLSELSPLNKERAQVLYKTFETSCRGVVLGISLSGFVQGFFLFILFLVCGLPNAFLAGSLTVIMGMVPLIGSSPIWIGAAIYLFVQGHPILGIAMLGGGIVITTSDNIVRSLVMAGQSELHPLLALVSVFGAINLFGAAGILLGPIIAAVFVAFLKIVSMELK